MMYLVTKSIISELELRLLCQTETSGPSIVEDAIKKLQVLSDEFKQTPACHVNHGVVDKCLDSLAEGTLTEVFVEDGMTAFTGVKRREPSPKKGIVRILEFADGEFDFSEEFQSGNINVGPSDPQTSKLGLNYDSDEWNLVEPGFSENLSAPVVIPAAVPSQKRAVIRRKRLRQDISHRTDGNSKEPQKRKKRRIKHLAKDWSCGGLVQANTRCGRVINKKLYKEDKAKYCSNTRSCVYIDPKGKEHDIRLCDRCARRKNICIYDSLDLIKNRSNLS